MFIAAQGGFAECVEVLARHGADVTSKMKSVRCAGLARCDTFIHVVTRLSQNGASPIIAAADTGNVECIDALVRHGADVNTALSVRTSLGLSVCAIASSVVCCRMVRHRCLSPRTRVARSASKRSTATARM